ncbi:DNA polymerase III subunit alpha, partial [bacterium]|nr:DNA polymerase III subunit alpha [bacterium]
LRASFLEGAVHNGILKGQAEKIFDLIFKFAEYGFNKSHSAAYALISYRTAYLKAHYPVEFMAALLTSELSKTDKVRLYISECQRLKIKILPPDINQSVTDFKVGKKPVPGSDRGPVLGSARGKEIRFGLGAIKNVGEKAIKEIVRQREEKGEFKSLYDFCERLDLRLVNKRVIESLIKAGCFDSLGARRSQLMASSDHALEVASKNQKDRESGQVSFLEVFDKEEGFSQKYQQLEDIPEWPENKLLSYEKEVLGLYLTSHPLTKYEEELASYTTFTIAQLKECPSSNTSAVIGGVILSFRTTNTKKGKTMSYVNLEDLSGHIEVLVFPSKYEELKEEIVRDRLVIIKGKMEKEEENQVKFFADEIIPIQAARQKLSPDLHIKVKPLYLEEEVLNKLKKIMEKYKGDNACYLHLQTAHHGEVVISPTCKVGLRKEMEGEIKKVLGEESIWLKVG